MWDTITHYIKITSDLQMDIPFKVMDKGEEAIKTYIKKHLHELEFDMELEEDENQILELEERNANEAEEASLLSARTCPSCHSSMKLSETGRAYICYRCYTVIEIQGEIRCTECFKELEEGTICYECKRKKIKQLVKKERDETFYLSSRSGRYGQ